MSVFVHLCAGVLQHKSVVITFPSTFEIIAETKCDNVWLSYFVVRLVHSCIILGYFVTCKPECLVKIHVSQPGQAR